MRPTVHSAVLPAITPDRATDFLALGAAAGAFVVHLSLPKLAVAFLVGFLLREQRVEFLLVVVVAEVRRTAPSRVCIVSTTRSSACRRGGSPRRRSAPPCSWRGTPTADTAPSPRRRCASSSTVNSGVAPNSVMLASTGTFTASTNRRYVARSVTASGRCRRRRPRRRRSRARSRLAGLRPRARRCAP